MNNISKADTPPKIRSFYDLNSWQEAKNLSLMVYRATGKFPKSEQFGLINQMRRASVSVPSNIAEGFPRSTKKDKQHFLVISKGSIAELQCQVIISKKLGFMDDKASRDIFLQCQKVDKLIGRMVKSLNQGNGIKKE